MGVPPVKIGPHPFLFFDDRPKSVLYGRNAILQWKSYALLPNREWNQKQKHKKPLAVHGEKPLMITRFLGKKPHQISQTILHGRDAILRVRAK